MTLVPIWMSPGPGDSGTPLGLKQVWFLLSSTGPRLVLVNMLHLGLIWTWFSGPYQGIMGTYFYCMACRLASPGPGNSGPYLGIIGTRLLCMACS